MIRMLRSLPLKTEDLMCAISRVPKKTGTVNTRKFPKNSICVCVSTLLSLYLFLSRERGRRELSVVTEHGD